MNKASSFSSQSSYLQEGLESFLAADTNHTYEEDTFRPMDLVHDDSSDNDEDSEASVTEELLIVLLAAHLATIQNFHLLDQNDWLTNEAVSSRCTRKSTHLDDELRNTMNR